MRPVIALLTDFGLQDHYVGTMKGVMAGVCPDASFVDITHDIPPQDVFAAALELAAAYRFFPVETVFLCVVDPGVGSTRRAVAVRAGAYTFVAPDNGVVSLAVGEVPIEAVELTNPKYALASVSRTFDGRDRFAPAAAWLANGVELASCGRRIEDIVRIQMPPVRTEGAVVDGEVVRVDRFGNLVTNIGFGLVGPPGEAGAHDVTIAGRSIPIVSTYADVGRGDSAALVGSTGYLEISVNGGSAAATLGCGRGTRVRVARRA